MDTIGKIEVLAAVGLSLAALVRYRKRRRYPETCRIVAMFIYPVKGLKGIKVQSAEALGRGFKHDRRFMIVDEEGNFTTQRENPVMATIKCEILQDAVLRLTAADGSSISVTNWEKGSKRTVRVWRDMVDNAIDQGEEAADFLTNAIGNKKYRLVFMNEETHRPVNPDRVDNHEVSFADGYPYLIASVESLADLNRRIMRAGGDPVPMTRFRPNIVVEGLYPWVEDINGVRFTTSSGLVFRTVKPCDRCKVTTTDQDTGLVNPSQEPLKTLRTFRRITGGVEVFFATNAILEKGGSGLLFPGVVNMEWFPKEPIKANAA